VKYLDEYRDGDKAREYARQIARLTTRPWSIMEVCGGQTHAIVKFGLDEILPKFITLIHGPGCPVCVTPLEFIDKAIEIASRSDTIFCSFGDMLRVPGSASDLLSAKAGGGDVRMVYSPTDALKIAAQNPGKEVVFFAVGFETTAPATAMAAHQAAEQGVKNFSMLVSHVLAPPAMEALLSSPDCRIQGFLAAGHVCAVMGCAEYAPIAAKYRVPIVVTGFEPLDILQGVLMCVRQLEEGRAVVENQYSRVVRPDGNPYAQELIRRVFEVTARRWRGLGQIPASGLRLRSQYEGLDAEKRFGLAGRATAEPAECLSGLVLQGRIKPVECPAFGRTCVPEHPLGAPMVSSEGACAAYYRYRNHALASGLSDAPAQEVVPHLSNQETTKSGDVAGDELHGIQFVEIPDEHWSGSVKEMRQRADAIMRTHTVAQHPKLGEIKLSGRQGRAKTLGHMKTPHEFQSVQAIPEVASKGTLVSSEPDREGRHNLVAVHKIERGVKIGETKYKAQAIVRESRDGSKTTHHFYLHRIDPVANGKTGSPYCSPRLAAVRSGPAGHSEPNT
jgi:hydrogenase expression/formation protein HypD